MGNCCHKSESIKKYFEVIDQSKKKPFTASARKIGTASKYTLTQIMAVSIEDAKQWFKNHGYETDGEIL